MGFGVQNDRRGFTDPQHGMLVQARTAPAQGAVQLNPLSTPSMRTALPFTIVEIGGRHYSAPPWRANGRIVIPNLPALATDAVTTASDRMAEAEGLAAAETSPNASICSFNIPRGTVAIVTYARVRFGDNIALQKVQIALTIGSATPGNNPQTGNGNLAVAGGILFFNDLDERVELSVRGDENKVVRLTAMSQDPEMPHYIEGEIGGLLFPASVLGNGAPTEPGL